MTNIHQDHQEREQHGHHPGHGGHPDTLEITIQSTRGTKQFSLPKEMKIAAVINEAVTAFGFAPGDNFELVLATNPGDPLRPERTLASYQVKDGDILILTAIGGGV